MSRDLLKKIVKILDDKKAEDIEIIEIKELTIISDYFVLASGTSTTHIKALTDELEERLSAEGIRPRQIEGRATGWILLDYQNIVVHIFLPDAREYYNLSRLWNDAARIAPEELLSPIA